MQMRAYCYGYIHTYIYMYAVAISTRLVTCVFPCVVYITYVPLGL